MDYFNIPYDKAIVCDYNDFYDEVKFLSLLDYDEILMTDYSVSNEIVQRILDNGKKLIILDHHEGSETLKEIINENFTLVHDRSISGTMITYNYFKPTTQRVKKIFLQFVTLIDTYDLFKTEDSLWEDAQNMNRILWGCLSWSEEGIDKYSFIKDYWFNKLNKFQDWTWTEFENKKIKSAVDIENKQYIYAKSTLKEFTDDKMRRYAVAVASKKISIVANRLLNENKELDYLIMVNNYTGNWDKLSLRSRDEDIFNCNSFEECKGHGCAAGGEVDPKFAAELWKGTKQLTYKVDI
jgi:oligoribonuclease NrnB/cAMP/cGMP phosphodiesterase (DHH superfamily)